MSTPNSRSSIAHACLAALAAGAFSPLAATAAAPPETADPAAGLPRVVISATRFADDADLLPAGVSVLTAKEIRDSGASTINEAIMKLLGVPGRQDLNGGGDYTLDLRGFGATADSNQVVVVDGVRMNEGDLSSTSLAGIAIDSVERIEVLRGSGSVLYGEGATGGVIVVTTKAGAQRERRNGGQAYVGVGSRGLIETRATATLVAGDVSADLSANRSRSDGFRANFGNKKEGGSATVQWARDGLRMGGRLAYDDLDSGLPGSLTAAQYAADPRQTTSPNDHGDIRNTRGGVFASLDVGDWQFAADAGLRHKELRAVSGSPYGYDVDARVLALKARHRANFGSVTQALTVGFDRNDWTRNRLGSGEATANSGAFYVQDDLSFTTGTRLSLGARREHARKTSSGSVLDERKTAWELGLTQTLAQGMAVYGRVGNSFRFPSVDEFTYVSPGAVLKVQSSRDVELGGRWFNDSSRAELRVYRSALTQEIGFDPNAPGPFASSGANVNFDPTRRQGVELEGTHRVLPTLQLGANAALRRATFRAGPYAGRDVPLTPRKTLALRANWEFLPAQQLSAVVNVVASQHPDFDNACRMPTYTTVDARYALQALGAQWAVGVVNLTDQKYYTQAFGCAGGQTTSIYPEAGRMLNASVRVQF